ncbi:MAG: hypothetical protein JJT78_03325 [Leptospira sp.]|nr:hypothetical protein [Leptospira sp.]
MSAVKKNQNYIIDEDGNKIAVVIDIATYKKLLDESEELASISAYDDGMSEIDQAIPFASALQDIRKQTI